MAMSEKYHPDKKAKHNTTATANTAVDRISNLPYPILHQILSFLPYIEVIKTCVLSKTFQSVFTSFPVIDLSGLESPREKMQELVDYFDYRTRRLPLDINLQKFGFRANIMDRRQGNRVIKHIDFATRKGVQEIDVDLVYPRYTLTQTITSANLIKILNLSGLKLINLADLKLNCWWPLLEILSICRCTGLKYFDFCSSKIKSITLKSCVGLKRIKIQSPSLGRFIYLGTVIPCVVDVTGCEFIKVLSLGNTKIGDSWVEDNVPKFLHLEDLELKKLQPGSGKLMVSSQSLKKLDVHKKDGIVQIHAPNLESLAYYGDTTSRLSIDPACLPLKSLSWKSDFISERCFREQISHIVDMRSLELVFSPKCFLQRFEMKHQKSLKLLPAKDKTVEVKIRFPGLVSFRTRPRYEKLFRDFFTANVLLDVMVSINSDIPMGNDAFIELWDWIASFGYVKVLTLAWFSAQVLVNLENDLEDTLTPMYDLKHLTIKLSTQSHISQELVNRFLLKSPNLESMNFISAGGVERSLEFVYSSRTPGEDPLRCCRRLKCWRHSMRRVILKNFGGVESWNMMKYFIENAELLDKIRL